MAFTMRAPGPQEPPQGVCLVAPDGCEYPCDVLRDAAQDTDGIAVWVVVPREKLPAVRGEWQIKARLLPGRSQLVFRLSVNP